MKNSHRQCIIACDTLGDLHQSNIKVLNDCIGDDMLKIMARSHCVVIRIRPKKADLIFLNTGRL